MSSTTDTPQADPAWTEADLTDPHAKADKAARVQRMFAAIAPSYDLNNRLHSLWRDQAWRRAAVKAADLQPDDIVLDAACGTGDLAIAFRDAMLKFPKGRRKAIWPGILGVDFTQEMLSIAAWKSYVPPCPGGGDWEPYWVDGIQYACGDAMNLPAADETANVVSIAFGIRNVTDPGRAMHEFHRVLRPGGRLVILEFSLPRNRLLRGLYNFYFKHVMPRTAALIARDRSGAYKYLPRSVNTFIDRDRMVTQMEDAGFEDVTVKPLTFGIAVIYRGVKARNELNDK